jgi:integrase/recombinase XerD
MDELKLLQFEEKMQLAGYASRTVEGYLENMRLFCEYLKEKESLKSLDQVKPEHLRGYQSWLAFEWRHKGRTPSASGLIQRLHAVKTFYRIMHGENLEPFNYGACIVMPRRQAGLPRHVPDVKTMQKLIEAPPLNVPSGLRDRCLMELLYSTGIRNTELRTLTLDSFDLAQKTIHIKGKGGKERIVPLGEWLLPFFREYLQTARPKLLARVKTPTALLFPTRNGRMFSDKNLCRIIRRYARRMKISTPMNVHAFRHACATHLIQAGADIRYVQELLGHASLNTTQIYTRVTIKDLKEAHRKYHPRERGLQPGPDA